MDIIQAIILGAVQGATEFLPVSSSAHLVIVPYLIGVNYSNVAFDTLLHIATLIAVIGYFWKELILIINAFISSLLDIPKRRFKRGIGKDPLKRFSWLIIMGSLPAGLMGIVFEDFFENLFNNPPAVGVFLIITGFILWYSEKIYRNFPFKRRLQDARVGDALLVGIAQGCAIIPGISRSGATIAMGLSLRFEREFAARYSFLLSIPTILGAALVQIEGISSGFVFEAQSFILGFIAATLSGYFAIKYFLKFIKTKNLLIFSFYCWILGILTIITSFSI